MPRSNFALVLFMAVLSVNCCVVPPALAGLAAGTGDTRQITLDSGEKVELPVLSTIINGVRVEGLSMCDQELMRDVLQSVLALFEGTANEKAISVSCQFIRGSKDSSVINWTEHWTASGVSSLKRYDIEFKFIPGKGTSFYVRHINS